MKSLRCSSRTLLPPPPPLLRIRILKILRNGFCLLIIIGYNVCLPIPPLKNDSVHVKPVVWERYVVLFAKNNKKGLLHVYIPTNLLTLLLRPLQVKPLLFTEPFTLKSFSQISQKKPQVSLYIKVLTNTRLT